LEGRDWAKDGDELYETIERMRKMKLSTIVFGHHARAFGKDESDKIASYDLIPEDTRKPAARIIKIDTDMAYGPEVSNGRLLFFDKPSEMKRVSSPPSTYFSTRKMKRKKKLTSCFEF